MNNIIKINFDAPCSDDNKVINIDVVKQESSLRARKTLGEGLISPATEDISYEIANEHTSDPIKSVDEIYAISDWFINNNRYRDNMLFIVGINFGLRVSDLLTLRFSHLIDDQFRFKTTFPILEKKTKNTRKVRKNRYITINDAVIEAVTLYLEHTPGVKLSDYMFKGVSNRNTAANKPMHRNSVEKILKEVGYSLGLEEHIATHTLRKTFAYHQMLISNNDPRKLLLLQKIFGHSSVAQTLEYIGITREEIESAYAELNLGGVKNRPYPIDSLIGEIGA